MISWACGWDGGGDKECIKNFGEKISWKMFTWKTKEKAGL